MTPMAPNLALMISLVHRDQLAQMLGYQGATNAFREFCARMRITCVPGRKGWYDPQLVRRRLDEAQGLQSHTPAPQAPLSKTEQWRQRRAS